MNLSKLSRQTVALLIFFSYWVPIVALSSIQGRPLLVFLLGLLLASSGTYFLFYLIKSWELKKRATIAPPEYQEATVAKTELAEWKNRCYQLESEIHSKIREIDSLKDEKKAYEDKLQTVHSEWKAQNEKISFEYEEDNSKIKNLQKIIEEQRSLLETKEQRIAELESKEKELSYEIKTLAHAVHIEDSPFPLEAPPVRPTEVSSDMPVSASLQLKRCLDIARKLTGSSPFGQNTSRLRDFQIDNYALELRRLFDYLRMEHNGLIIFYSPQENRVLYSSASVKDILGWSAEKFALNFSEIIHASSNDWREGIKKLLNISEVQMPVVMRTKNGQERIFQCNLGMITSGTFRNHVLGVLYPNDKNAPA